MGQSSLATASIDTLPVGAGRVSPDAPRINRDLGGVSFRVQQVWLTSKSANPEWRRLSLQGVSLGVIVAPLAEAFYAVFNLPARFVSITETAANECGAGGGELEPARDRLRGRAAQQYAVRPGVNQ
jgi:hypothetical protein